MRSTCWIVVGPVDLERLAVQPEPDGARPGPPTQVAAAGTRSACGSKPRVRARSRPRRGPGAVPDRAAGHGVSTLVTAERVGTERRQVAGRHHPRRGRHLHAEAVHVDQITTPTRCMAVLPRHQRRDDAAAEMRLSCGTSGRPRSAGTLRPALHPGLTQQPTTTSVDRPRSAARLATSRDTSAPARTACAR